MSQYLHLKIVLIKRNSLLAHMRNFAIVNLESYFAKYFLFIF